MKTKNTKFNRLSSLVLSAAMVILMVQFVPVKISAAETGSGSSTVYYNIQLKSGTNFNDGDDVMLASDNSRANSTYVGFALPTGIDARGTIASIEGTWDTSYSPKYGLDISLRSSQMDEHNGWIAWTGSAWLYHCTGGSDRGTYYAYTLQSSSFGPSNVTVTEKNALSGTVSPTDLTVQISVPGSTLTLADSDYTIPNNTLNPANGDCTYALNINGVTITKFKSDRADTTIDNITGLTDDQKNTYKTELDSATNDSQVKTIVDKAKDKGAANVAAASAKPEINTLIQTNKDIINALTNLTDSQKLIFCNTLDNKAAAIKNNMDNAANAASVEALRTNGINDINEILDRATADNFVKGFLTGRNGSIYTDINSSNVDQILSGRTAWDTLTSAQKNFINASIDAENILSINSYNDYIASANTFVTERSTMFKERYLQINNIIHLTATIGNYQQILSGENLWNEMSKAEKDAINMILIENGSKSYDELLYDAKGIKAELDSIKTGDESQLIPFIYLMLLSSTIAAIALLYNKKKAFNK